ncbi:MAG: porin [Alphaproteobacteria bacterium]
MKTSSRSALIVAAGMLMGAYAYGPANAADLGGGCCADLEERVAELEATTARKGNRVVSLQVYGQVNKALMYWDDGVESDTYVVDNALSSSRFGFVGKGKMKPGWIAGYRMEFEIQDALSNSVTQSSDENAVESTVNAPTDGLLTLRHNYLYVESVRLGRFSIGHQSSAADGAHEVVLANSMRTGAPDIGDNLSIRDKSGGAADDGVLSNWAGDLDSGRNDLIRYDTPSIYGFILSASWGDDDYADVALRFKKEFNSIRIAAAVAYQWDGQADNTDFETIGGSISIMHVPTGLYAAFAAAERDYEVAATADVSFWYVQAGIERKWLPYGTTTLYGEYGNYDDFAIQAGVLSNATSSQTTRWGFGFNQKFDSVAMDVYAHATFWDFDYTSSSEDGLQEGLTTVLVGSRIQF